MRCNCGPAVDATSECTPGPPYVQSSKFHFALTQRVWHTYIIQHNHSHKKFKVDPGNKSLFPPSTSLWSSAMHTREATHPTVAGLGHSIRKCFRSSTCVHLATSDIFVYTVATVDNSHQRGYPSHHDDSHG